MLTKIIIKKKTALKQQLITHHSAHTYADVPFRSKSLLYTAWVIKITVLSSDTEAHNNYPISKS